MGVSGMGKCQSAHVIHIFAVCLHTHTHTKEKDGEQDTLGA